MLPTKFQYSGFKGTLNEVELVDLEVDEAVRAAKVVEKLSEAVLNTKKGVSQKVALSKLGEYKSKVAGNVQQARQQAEASQRVAKKSAEAVGQTNAPKEELVRERFRNLEAAQSAEKNIASNVFMLNQTVENQTSQSMAQSQQVQLPQSGGQNQSTAWQAVGGMPTPTPQEAGFQPPVPQQQSPQTPAPEQAVAETTQAATLPALQFPRVGDVFVFRQLQGTGKIGFKYASRESAAALWDLVFALAVVGVLAAFLTAGRRLVSTRRRVAVVLLVVFGAMALARVALDIAMPGVAVVLVLLLAMRKGG